MADRPFVVQERCLNALAFTDRIEAARARYDLQILSFTIDLTGGVSRPFSQLILLKRWMT
jgi:hypothetical protein